MKFVSFHSELCLKGSVRTLRVDIASSLQNLVISTVLQLLDVDNKLFLLSSFSYFDSFYDHSSLREKISVTIIHLISA